MALLSFRGISTPSLPAQGEQRRFSYFNIQRGNPTAAGSLKFALSLIILVSKIKGKQMATRRPLPSERETQTIPIVFVNAADPVGSGLVAGSGADR